MKWNLALSSALFLCSFTFNAQNNLQFNNALLVGASSVEVPAGRIWKIESVISNSNLAATGGTSVQAKSTQILINSVVTHINQCSTFQGSDSGSNANPRPHGYACSDVTKLPIWLPAGTTLAAGTNTQSISVLEFVLAP